jgi:hypothetical protein
MRTPRLLAAAFGAAATAALLAACATPTSPGEVARNWSCRLREMQIHPIFPPREDVQVGDVYWFEQIAATDAAGYCKGATEFMPIPPYVAYLNLTRQVDSHYGSRPHLPRTSTAEGTVTITATGITVTPPSAPSGSAEGERSPFSNGSNARTRIVGFPDFMTVHVSKFALGAIVPIEGVLAPIGIARENVRDATLSIPVAESYSVPASVVGSALTTKEQREALCAAASFAAPEGAGQYQIVNEVYYTRAIDVNIHASTALSVSVDRSRAGATSSSVPSGTTTGIVTESTTTGSVTHTITKVSDGMLHMLQARNSVPGVSVAYEQGDELSVKMRRLFDRPVAIGFRAVGVKVTGQGDKCQVVGVPAKGGTPALAPK